MRRVDSIQYLRGLAALAVVLYHANHVVTGAAGVDVFFVISGFVIQMTAAKRPVGPAEFIWHRIVRVVPLYWLATISIGAVGVFGHMAPHFHVRWSDFVESLLFIPHRDLNGEVWPVVVQGWTLTVEVMFYAVFAAALATRTRRPAVMAASVLLGAVLIGRWLPGSNAAIRTYTDPMLMEFIAGLALAQLWLQDRLPKRFGTGVLAVLLSAAGLALAWCVGYQPPFALSVQSEASRLLFFGVPAMLLVWGALVIEASGHLSRSAMLDMLGDASYAIYLVHVAVLVAVARLLPGADSVVRTATVVVISVLLATIIHRWFERPVSAKLRQFASGAVAQANLPRRRLVPSISRDRDGRSSSL